MRCATCGNTSEVQGATSCRVCGSSLPLSKSRTRVTDSSHYKKLSGAKRHLLVRVGAPPVELKAETEVRIGRSRECDLVVQSPRVSRVHALIFWVNGAPSVRDLVSQNGVWVNGAQVREARLVDGDELTIGPFACTYRRLDAINSLNELNELLDSQADTQEVEATAMSGRLAEVSFFEVLETLALHARTGTVEVYGPWGDEGRIGVRDGSPVWAQLADLEGRAAIEALLDWTEGHFRFSSASEEHAVNVTCTLQEILDEVRRRSEHGLDARDYQG